MNSPVVHFEIGCKDKVKTCGFYKSLFGWGASPEQPFVMPDQKENAIGGHINSLGHEPHNYVTVYVQVDDLAASLKKAESLGGKVIVPPQEVPDMGHFAWFADPEGNVLGMWKPMQK